MEKKHFCLFEPGEINHIGTVSVEADNVDTLILKIEKACSEHFDAAVSCEHNELDIKNKIKACDSFKYNYQTFEIEVGDLGDEWNKEIAICRTWIY